MAVSRPSNGSIRRDGGIGLLRLRRLSDRFRQSLFFLPAMFVVGSVGLGLLTVELDRTFGESQLPDFLSTTVPSARAILSTTAGGTIGAASVVFSLTLLAVQLASSQFSPRVLRGFLGDRFQQIVMGIVVGTFTYSLVVLRVVQDIGEDSDRTPFLPQISVIVVVVLAVTSLLAVLGSIDHTAKSLRLGALIDRITDETLTVIRQRYAHLDDEDAQDTLTIEAPGIVPSAPLVPSSPDSAGWRYLPPDDTLEIHADRAGWVTQISIQGLLEVMPENTTLLLETAVGTYVSKGAILATLWPPPEDTDGDGPPGEDGNEGAGLSHRLHRGIEVRRARTMQQDVSFGILQLTDVALRALSPGVNDPNTANEVIVRLGTLLTEMLQRRVSGPVLESESRTLVRGREVTTADFIDAAIEPVRRYARTDPRVLEVLVRTLASMRTTAARNCTAAIDDRGIDDQLRMIAIESDQLTTPADRERVMTALREIGSGDLVHLVGKHDLGPRPTLAEHNE